MDSIAMWFMTATTANGGRDSTLGTIQSKTKCRTASGPAETALQLTTPHNDSIAIGSENDKGWALF